MNSVIESGRIIKCRGSHIRQDGAEVEGESVYEMRFLDESAMQEMLDLQELVVHHLPVPEIFRQHDRSYLQELFRRGQSAERSALGVTTRKGLIAYSIIHFPGLARDNLGRDIGLPERELEKVAHLQAAMVHPAYRGNGLQRKMAAQHQKVIKNLGCEHVCCTISPWNPYSLRNMLASGFGIRGLVPKFEGWWRFIMYKNVLHGMNLDEGGEEILINAADIQGQIELLNRGFVGRREIPFPCDFEVCYQKACIPHP